MQISLILFLNILLDRILFVDLTAVDVGSRRLFENVGSQTLDFAIGRELILLKRVEMLILILILLWALPI